MSILKLVFFKFWYITIPLIILFFWLKWNKKNKNIIFVYLATILVIFVLLFDYFKNTQDDKDFIPTSFDETGKLKPSQEK